MKKLYVLIGIIICTTQAHFLHVAMPSSRVVSDLISQALTTEEHGDIDKAIELHKEIVALQPSNIYSLNSIAGLYGKQEMYKEEICWAKKAIAINENFDLAYINFGNALVCLGRNEEAKDAYNKARKIDPQSALPYYSLGVLADKENEDKEALEYYKKAIALDSHFIDAHFNIGVVYANLKKYDHAIAAFEKVLVMQPNAEDAKQMLVKMRRLKNTAR